MFVVILLPPCSWSLATSQCNIIIKNTMDTSGTIQSSFNSKVSACGGAGSVTGSVKIRGLSKLTSLPSGLFDQLTNLKTNMILADNALVSLPNNLFDKITQLTTTLWIGSSTITSLPAGVFDSFKNTKIGTFELTVLHSGVLDKMTAMTTLSLSGVTTLPAGIFAKLTALKSVTIPLSLTSVNKNLFTHQSNLDTLYYSSNEVPTGLFTPLTKLNWLRIYFTSSLNSLPAGAFDTCTQLTDLKISDTQITTLPNSIFDKLSNLATLKIENNMLVSLPNNVFKMTNLVKTLDLSNNRLTSLPSLVFASLTQAESLDLKRNDLVDLSSTQIFGASSKVKHLSFGDASINNIKITKISSSLFAPNAWTVTEKFTLEQTDVKWLPADFLSAMPNITVLDLNNNAKITALPYNFFYPNSQLLEGYIYGVGTVLPCAGGSYLNTKDGQCTTAPIFPPSQGAKIFWGNIKQGLSR